MGQKTRRPSVRCSKYYLFFIKSCKILCQNPFNFFFKFFYKITKMKTKSFDCPKSIRNFEKKIVRTSDTWLTSLLSHRPSKPAYYIVDCRILYDIRFCNPELETPQLVLPYVTLLTNMACKGFFLNLLSFFPCLV